MHLRFFLLIAPIVLLSSCSSIQKQVSEVTNSGAAMLGTVSEQLKDGVTLGQQGMDRATEEAEKIKQRATEVQEGMQEMQDGAAKIKNGMN